MNSGQQKALYSAGEKFLCYHGALIYEAKCLQVGKNDSNEFIYFVHYNGWSKNWDEWVTAKRILKYNAENLKKQKELIVTSRYSLNNNKKLKMSDSSSSQQQVNEIVSSTLPTTKEVKTNGKPRNDNENKKSSNSNDSKETNKRSKNKWQTEK